MGNIDEHFDDIAAIEQELRGALRHVPAPAGFADRVLSRVEQTHQRERQAEGRTVSFLGSRSHAGWWAAVAAAVLVAIGGGDALHVHQQRQAREAAAAQAQMDMAMQLTSHALNEVETGLDRSPAGRFAQLWNGTGN